MTKHLLKAMAFAAFLGTTPALADSHDCAVGTNILEQLASNSPATAATIKKEADETVFGRGLTWKIEKDGVAPSYLFGTIHLADPRLLKLKPATGKAFKQSNTVALEITEILDPAVMASKSFSLMQFTTYTDETSLEDKLTGEQSAAVRKLAMESLGLPWSITRKMKPWALMGSIALPACELARQRSNKPVLDVQLGLNARLTGKTLIGLETLESQMMAMESLPEQFSIDSLIQAVELGPRMEDVFETMIQLYLKEEIATIWSMFRHLDNIQNGLTASSSSDYAEFQKILVDKRNIEMVQKAIPLIDKGGAFIAVGALHLPGELGIANILAQKGYRLTRVSN